MSRTGQVRAGYLKCFYYIIEEMFEERSNKNLPAFARVHAHLCGDGGLYYYKTTEHNRVHRAEICYFNNNPKLISSFRKDMYDLFGVKGSYFPNRIKIRVKSIKIAKFLLKYNKYGCREWRIPEIIKSSSDDVKIEWVKAFSHDEAYLPKDRNVIRIKCMNLRGLNDIKSMLSSVNIHSNITGQNCDGSWYLNIKKEGRLRDFTKVSARKKSSGG